MADTENSGAPLKQEEGVEQKANGNTQAQQETDTNGKIEVLSPKKRDRPHVEDNESTGSATKRVKGVAPIKTEYAQPHMITAYLP